MAVKSEEEGAETDELRRDEPTTFIRRAIKTYQSIESLWHVYVTK